MMVFVYLKVGVVAVLANLDTILFDLDGTLLPMETDRFIDLYYDGLAITGEPYGFDRQYLFDVIEEAFVAMIHNPGTMTNKELFFSHVKDNAGSNYDVVCEIFERFSDREFDKVKECTGFNPMAGQWIKTLKAKGYRVILATNPLFPGRCTERRIRWAGMDPEDFELVTSYENHFYAKPSKEYYKEIIAQEQLVPEHCLMVGNDVREDMIAKELGMEVFLLKNNIVNSRNLDYSMYPQGFYEEFTEVINSLPSLI